MSKHLIYILLLDVLLFVIALPSCLNSSCVLIIGYLLSFTVNSLVFISIVVYYESRSDDKLDNKITNILEQFNIMIIGFLFMVVPVAIIFQLYIFDVYIKEVQEWKV